jgi:hypothetical protein
MDAIVPAPAAPAAPAAAPPATPPAASVPGTTAKPDGPGQK